MQPARLHRQSNIHTYTHAAEMLNLHNTDELHSYQVYEIKTVHSLR
jgi:hypothetical protein